MNGRIIVDGGSKLINAQIGLILAKPEKIQMKNRIGTVIKNNSIIGKLDKKESRLVSTDGGSSPQKFAYCFRKFAISAI